MDNSIIVALITGGLAIVSNMIIAMMNSKLMLYRIEQLEKKQDKYNNLQERMIKAEASDKAQWQYIDQFKEVLEKR